MDANIRQEAYQNLIFLADKQGYVTFDDIMNCADDYSLPIQDFDWLSNAITTRGVLVYSKNPNMQSAGDTEFDDYAQSDYEAVYNRIIELCPSMETFVTQVRNILPPQHGEMSRLKYQIADGNFHARNRMVEMHLRNALRIALGRAETYDVDIEETIGDACVGLLYAVDKYDPDTSGAFASYASLWILQNISRTQVTKRPLIYYPAHRKEEYFTIYPLVKNRGCIGCKKMISCHTLMEIIEEKLNCSEFEAKNVILQMIPFERIDDYIKIEINDNDDYSESNLALKEILSKSIPIDDVISEYIYKYQLKEAVEKILSTLLSAKEARIIKLRFGFFGYPAMTLEQIASFFNVTRERVRQIETKALTKLRNSKRCLQLHEFINA